MTALYWGSTSLLCLFLALSAGSYFVSESTIVGVRELGFPDFFRVQLGILKLVAVLVLLLPQVPLPAKEWAYAGAGLFLLTALVAHVAHGDSIWLSVLLVAFMALLVASRVTLPTDG